MTAISFPDAQLATRNLLRGILAARSEPAALGATVSTKEPPGADEGRTLPWIQVRADPSYRNARLNGRAPVRFRIWHRDEGLGLSLGALCEALLLDATSAEIRNFSPLTGPAPTEDPDTGEPLTYFTLTARPRPQQL